MEETQEGKLPSEIIGMRGVHGFADFYTRFPQEVAKMKDGCLIQYCDEQEFSQVEYSAFKQGVATVMKFFLSCKAESEVVLRAKKQALEKAKK